MKSNKPYHALLLFILFFIGYYIFLTEIDYPHFQNDISNTIFRVFGLTTINNLFYVIFGSLLFGLMARFIKNSTPFDLKDRTRAALTLVGGYVITFAFSMYYIATCSGKFCGLVVEFVATSGISFLFYGYLPHFVFYLQVHFMLSFLINAFFIYWISRGITRVIVRKSVQI